MRLGTLSKPFEEEGVCTECLEEIREDKMEYHKAAIFDVIRRHAGKVEGLMVLEN